MTSIRLIFEVLLIFGPFILSVTLLSDYVYVIIFVLLFLICFILFLGLIRRWQMSFLLKDKEIFKVNELMNIDLVEEKRLTFVTNLFSSLLLCVIISILAVDFQLFPRRFAKTETYGWSLMDVGVGAFVAINAGLSPESRMASQFCDNSFYFVKKTFLSIIPVIVLGFQRLIVVKNLNYHEHITEYGLHWNFFFTLALTKVIFDENIICKIISFVII